MREAGYSPFKNKKANRKFLLIVISSGDHIGWLVLPLASIQSSKMQAIRQTHSAIKAKTRLALTHSGGYKNGSFSS
jgi:hypothetical protein